MEFGAWAWGNGTAPRRRSAAFPHLLYFKHKSISRGQDTLEAGSGAWVGREGAQDGFEKPGSRAPISVQWLGTGQA